MNRFLTLLLCLAGGFAHAQTQVQWASTVVGFSSQKSSKANAASTVLGSPNAMPQGGQNPNAWEATERENQYITVGFDKPQQAQQVVILENYMPGSVTKVTAIDTEGKSYVLAAYAEAQILEPQRVLTISMPKTAYQISKIRVDINPLIPEDNPQIDAIGLLEKSGPLSFIQLTPRVTLTASPERLNDDINSSYPEDAPLVTYDGSMLYFSRGLHPQNVGGTADIEDIWACKLQEDSSWSKPFNIGPPLNNKAANFIFSVTKNNQTLLLGNIYGANGRMEAGASLVNRKADGTFGMPTPLRILNDYNKNPQVDYFLNSLGNVLIISEERDDSYGERDLYLSFIQPDSSWSEPLNMGSNVNTASDEFAPFLSPDNRALYFSTAGRPGFGNVDIFVSYRLGDEWGNWTEPYNLGNKVNGVSRDSYFSIPARGAYAYFTNDDPKSTETNIFRVKYPRALNANPVFQNSSEAGTASGTQTPSPAIGQQLTEPTQPMPKIAEPAKPKPVTTAANETKQQPEIVPVPVPVPEIVPAAAAAQTDPMVEPAQKNVTANTTGKGKKTKNTAVNKNTDPVNAQAGSVNEQTGSGNEQAAAVKEKAAMAKPELLAVEPVYFDFALATPLDAAMATIDALVAHLVANPQHRVVLKGHADAKGEPAFNLKLSERRARNVAATLKEKGVTARQVRIRAYGEAKPADDNSTDDGRARNRRVECTVVAQ